MFVERVGGGEAFEVALVEFRGDFDDLHGDRFACGGEGAAVSEQERDVAAAEALGGEGVAVGGGIGVRDDRDFRGSGGGGAAVVRDVGAGDGGVFGEGFDGGGEGGDGGLPCGEVLVAGIDEGDEGGGVFRAESVEVEEVLACGDVMEFACEDEAADVAEEWIEVEALLEVGLGELEVGFAVFLCGFEGSRESGESYASLVEEDRLGAGGVVEYDAGLRGGGDGLLVDDGGA